MSLPRLVHSPDVHTCWVWLVSEPGARNSVQVFPVGGEGTRHLLSGILIVPNPNLIKIRHISFFIVQVLFELGIKQINFLLQVPILSSLL